MNKKEIYSTMVIRSQAETIELLEQENKQLKEKLDEYENPEDMTLMYMWCTEKVKDENKQLKERVAYLERSNNRREDEILSLRQELNDSEDCRYKAIEYIVKEYYSKNTTDIDKVIGGREVAIYRMLKGENNE